MITQEIETTTWRQRLLKEKVKPFLLSTRIGIDFGEGKGGIAVEQGREENGKIVNEIRHAEVFCDFHAATLKDRRDNRRGRRTRRAKKIRLARLRSWILRQPDPTKNIDMASWLKRPVSLPRDKRLPDPYVLMRDEKFQCQPFEYKVGKKQLDAKTNYKKESDNPNFLLPTWIEAVKNGKCTDSASFVIALTHIFQKRGYSYSDADLEELTDAQLEDFLASSALRNSPDDFKKKIKAQVERREVASEDEDQSWRGKEKVDYEELKPQFDQACNRSPQRRKAVHRREKVQLLNQVIESFINSISTLEAQTKKDLITKWQRALAGDLDQDFDPRKNPKGLINKVVRAPRFDNRVESGCAWCGKTCARKSKNRKKAYLAAVNNLRVYEVPPSSAHLAKERKGRLADLWQEGLKNPAEARQRFLNSCRHFGIPKDKQREFAGLFDNWRAGSEEANQKIKNLHVKLVGQKPRKLTKEESKKFEDIWKKDVPQENVSQDNQFWKNLSQKVSEVFTELRKGGHPVIKEEMKKQLTDLLAVKPKGRHRLCSACLDKAAKGETMFDQGIDPWTIKARSVRNPRREQHQQRVLARLEYLLFKARRRRPDGSKVVPDPRQIKYITLEIPKPQSTNRTKKGEQTKTERRSIKALLHEEAFGKCIYCDTDISVDQVTEDHIFPESWGGPDIRDVNLVCSCHNCNDGKRNSIPYLWSQHIKPSWQEFEKRVRLNSRMPARKKDILLLGSHGGKIENLESFKALGIPLERLTDEQRNEFAALANWKQGDPFPNDPTALARAGAMPRQFIQGIRKMFEAHGFKEDELPVITPKGDLPLMQRAEGWMTSRLRNSWRRDQNGQENFPMKRSEESLEHHVQDAALLAALPPHQWRDHVFIDIEKHARCDERGNPVRDANGKTVMNEFTVALKELAPNWPEFKGSRKQPLVRILESSRQSWRKSWRSQFIKKSFWQIFCPNKKCNLYIKPESLKGNGEIKCKKCGTALRRNGSGFLNVEIRQYKPHWESLVKCPHCQQELKELKRNGTIVGKQCKNKRCKTKFFQSDLQGQVRQRKKSQQQGKVLAIRPHNGPIRIVNVEAVADAICLVKKKDKANSQIHLRLQPAIASFTGAEFDPPLPANGEIIGEIRRNKFIDLPEKNKKLPVFLLQDTKTKKNICYPSALCQFINITSIKSGVKNVNFVFPQGRYRVKELSIKNAEVWFESIAGGVKKDYWCCPVLQKERLTDNEIKELKDKKEAVFKNFPERKLGIRELRELCKIKSKKSWPKK